MNSRLGKSIAGSVRDPSLPGVWNDLGLRFFEQGRLGDAISAFLRALTLEPLNPGICSNLGSAYQYRGSLGAAVDAYRKALSLAPLNASIHLNLGNALLEQGRAEEACTAFKCALALTPDLGKAEMNLAAANLYRPSAGLEAILTHARRWNRTVSARPMSAVPIDRSHPRPRIGLISADFRQHAVGYLTVPTIEGMVRAGYHVTGYSNSWRQDEITGRFTRACTQWRVVAGLDDARLVEQIRADGVDLLIDLSGFSAGNRLAALARKPAAIQIASWVGYPSTTGSDAMDYILADSHQVPDGAERFYSEKIIRLPDSYVAFEPPQDAPALTEAPCIKNGYVTFGSFNVLKKINPEVIAVWARILGQVENSRLVMKAGGLEDPPTRAHLIARFEQNGIDADRLVLAGNTSPAEHLGWMARADIALDPFPYSGGRTTLETLWMGLSVITMPSASFAGRHSLSYLAAAGLTQWVVADAAAYIELASDLARDPAGIDDWRRSLRSLILASPLADVDRFVGNLDRALSTAWQRRIDGSPPASFDIS